MRTGTDRLFLFIVIALVCVGFFVFVSASLGILARNTDQFGNIIFNQGVLGLFFGTIALLILSNVDYRRLRPFAPYLFVLSLIATALVFVPGFGFSAGGATRWLSLGPFSFQPSELLKIGFVIYFAALLSSAGEGVRSFTRGLLPFLGLLALMGAVMVAQPDLGTFGIIIATGLAMFFVAGARLRDLFGLVALGFTSLAALAYTYPYVMSRIMLFLDPSSDPLGRGYQIQQALIAIGSGGIFGRGFGQSIQKFNFLPEPIGDSVFAVASEEFGFLGAICLIILFVAFALRGLRIAVRTSDRFGALIAVGIVTHITIQSFSNIEALLGILPLTGIPLVFVSHGGTALFIALAEIGILLNISKYRKA